MGNSWVNRRGDVERTRYENLIPHLCSYTSDAILLRVFQTEMGQRVHTYHVGMGNEATEEYARKAGDEPKSLQKVIQKYAFQTRRNPSNRDRTSDLGMTQVSVTVPRSSN